jgi:hypothetical protein
MADKKYPTPKPQSVAKKPRAKKPAKVVPVVEPAPTVGPTGLCLQCKKPADHKHAGI